MPSLPRKACAGRSLDCLGIMEPGQSHCRPCGQAREHQRGNWDVRKLYRTARWRALRTRVLREEPFCMECEAETGRVVPCTDVDHTKPHRGNMTLFWSRANLSGKCHEHHSRKTQRGE